MGKAHVPMLLAGSVRIRRMMLSLRSASVAIDAPRTSAHIWSPPDLQDSVLAITGTGLLSYIRPVGEEFWNPLASMNYARIVLIILSALDEPMCFAGFRYAGLTCCVIAGHKIFAIVGRVTSC